MENNIQQTDRLNSVSSTASSSPSKPFIILLVAMLIIIVGVGAYTLGIKHGKTIVQRQQTTVSPAITQPSPTPVDETASWKTYTNTKVGFEIKYPSTYKEGYISNTTVPPPAGFSGGTKNVDGTEDNKVIHFPGSGPKYEVAFSLELFPYNGTMEDLPKLPAQKRLFGYSELEKPPVFKKAKINDNESIWFKRVETTDKRKFGEVTYEIYLVAKNHAFIFHANSELSENDMDQILSTFNFANISWDEAVELIRSCQVKMVSQTHSRNVDLTLKDGTIRITVEPKLDMVTEEAESASTKCGFDIGVETE